MIINTDQLVSATTAAKMCGISTQLLYYHVDKGGAPKPIIVDGVRYFDRDEVLEWDKTREKRAKKRG